MEWLSVVAKPFRVAPVPRLFSSYHVATIDLSDRNLTEPAARGNAGKVLVFQFESGARRPSSLNVSQKTDFIAQ
jgi:hypothetical protein